MLGSDKLEDGYPSPLTLGTLPGPDRVGDGHDVDPYRCAHRARDHRHVHWWAVESRHGYDIMPRVQNQCIEHGYSVPEVRGKSGALKGGAHHSACHCRSRRAHYHVQRVRVDVHRLPLS